MRKICFTLVLGLCALLLLAADTPRIPSMPAAVSGNAVASLKGGVLLFSLMGIGPKKGWDDVTSQVYVLRLASGKWSEGKAVPGVAGRLGASAAGVRGQVFLLGGFVLDSKEGEITVSDVNSYLPESQRWYRAADIPVAVDSAVVGVNRDRYIYLVGGRSKKGPVNNVQVYDAETDTWSQATPFPGPPVFGHSGGVEDDAIVYIDGAMKNPAEGAPYVVSDECWMGKIDKKDPNKITWSKLPAHPGSGRFGIAGGSGENRKVYFSGGTTQPHNYKGVTFDGKPIETSTVTFAFDLHGSRWEKISENTIDPRADSRGILATPLGPILLGGMTQNTAATARVTLLPKK